MRRDEHEKERPNTAAVLGVAAGTGALVWFLTRSGSEASAAPSSDTVPGAGNAGGATNAAPSPGATPSSSAPPPFVRPPAPATPTAPPPVVRPPAPVPPVQDPPFIAPPQPPSKPPPAKTPAAPPSPAKTPAAPKRTPAPVLVKAKAYPMPQLLVHREFRKARVSSQYKARNPSRPDHDGVDIVYQRFPGDPDWPTGDGEGSKNKKWIVPAGTRAVATADGVIHSAGRIGTGGYVWLAHDGVRAGYFHLDTILVKKGQRVWAGQSLGTIGDNPIAHDLRHLHFELSPVDRYRPMDPNPYLDGAFHFAMPVPIL